jgi:hypothetical protein
MKKEVPLFSCPMQGMISIPNINGKQKDGMTV